MKGRPSKQTDSISLLLEPTAIIKLPARTLIHRPLHLIRQILAMPTILVFLVVRNQRPTYPIHQTEAPEVTLRAAEQMDLGTAGNAAEKKLAGHDGVAGEGEGLFEGDERHVEQVGEHVDAEQRSGNIRRQESAKDVEGGVVVVRREGEGDAKGVVPGAMEFSDKGESAITGVQEVAVDKVCEYLRQRGHVSLSSKLGE